MKCEPLDWCDRLEISKAFDHALLLVEAAAADGVTGSDRKELAEAAADDLRELARILADADIYITKEARRRHSRELDRLVASMRDCEHG